MSFETLELSLDDLLLDTDNPRIGYVPSQMAALQSIIEINHNHFRNMMLSIKDNGLDPGDSLYVIKAPEEDGYIVLEGNRRLSAMMVLDNPNFLSGIDLSESTRKSLTRAATGFDLDTVEPIRCTLFSDRASAHDWITRRHTGLNNGEGRVPWGPTEVQRFEGDHSLLDILDFVERHTADTDEDWKDTKDVIESKKSSTLSRILDSRPGRDHLGLSFKSTGNQKRPYLATKPSWALKVLKKIIEDVRDGVITSRTTNRASDIEAYLDNLPKSLQPDPKNNETEKQIKDINLKNSRTAAKSTINVKGPAITGKNSPKPRKKLAPSRNPFNHPDDEKARKLLIEANKLDAGNYPVSCAFILRAFLELAIQKYMADNGIPTEEPNKKTGALQTLKLQTRVERVLSHLKTNKLISSTDERVFKKAVINSHSNTSIQALNDFIHHQFAVPTGDALRSAWDASTPIFIGIFGKPS